MVFWAGRRRSDIRFKLLLGFGTLLLVFWTFVLWHSLAVSSFIEEIELKAYDFRMSLNLPGKKHEPSRDIVIIAFDDPTLYGYESKYGTWPWPRTVHADMIKFLNQVDVKLIAYDLLFLSNKLGDKSADAALLEQFKKHNNVFIGMNFDNNRFKSLEGLEVVDHPPELIDPVSVPFRSELPPNDKEFNTGDDGFYANPTASFQNFRPVMKDFYDHGDRIYIINHTRDKDGVSRSNSLIFRYWADLPKRSDAEPYKFNREKNQWFDSTGKRINKEGLFLDEEGEIKQFPTPKYFPHMSLRLLEFVRNEELKNKGLDPQAFAYYVDPKNYLHFPGYAVPLGNDGVFYVNWYTNNILYDKLEEYVDNALKPKLAEARAQLANNPNNATLQQQVQKYENELATSIKLKGRATTPQPYEVIPAWRVIRASLNQKAGKLTSEDKNLIKFLKDKMIFVGSTAVASFDIKTTPVSRIMPGVIQQAVIFDNLYQNNGYIVRLPEWFNLTVTFFLCIVTALSIVFIRSAVLGLIGAIGVLISFVGLNIILFKQLFLWMDLTFPLLSQLITGLITYLVKYIGRDRDYEKTYQLATTDGLTGLHNHRFFQEFIHSCMSKSERGNTKTSLVLVDIDFFKKFNDTHGHQAGDEVLRLVAQKLKASVRNTDLVARYGGEEMAVVLPETNEELALQVGHKLVKIIGAEPYPIAPGVSKHVTISVGVATYPTHGKSVTELIEFADQGLYRAKEAGRNQVGAQYDEDPAEKNAPKSVPIEWNRTAEEIQKEQNAQSQAPQAGTPPSAPPQPKQPVKPALERLQQPNPVAPSPQPKPPQQAAPQRQAPASAPQPKLPQQAAPQKQAPAPKPAPQGPMPAKQPPQQANSPQVQPAKPQQNQPASSAAPAGNQQASQPAKPAQQGQQARQKPIDRLKKLAPPNKKQLPDLPDLPDMPE